MCQHESGASPRYSQLGAESGRLSGTYVLGPPGRIVSASYPRLPHPHPYSPHLIPEGRPSGGMPWVGMGAAPAASLARWTREASGHRPGGTTAPVRGARWRVRAGDDAIRRRRDAPQGDTGVEAGLIDPPRPISAARSRQIADERSATRRADSGSICPRRALARGRGYPLRRAALRCPSLRKPPRANAGGCFVMLGLVPSIHVFLPTRVKTWMGATRATMTVKGDGKRRRRSLNPPSPSSRRRSPSSAGWRRRSA